MYRAFTLILIAVSCQRPDRRQLVISSAKEPSRGAQFEHTDSASPLGAAETGSIESDEVEPVPKVCRPGCIEDGRCTLQGQECIVQSDSDCRWSSECAIEGLCSAVQGKCVAKTKRDCLDSVACSARGRCEAIEGRCTGNANGIDPLAFQPTPVPFSWHYNDPTIDRSIESIEAECAAHDVESCFALGTRKLAANSTPADLLRARDLFVSGCSQNHAGSCAWAGSDFELGRGGPTDVSRAAMFYRKGCRLGSGRGCHALGYLYQTGSGVPSDPELALLYHSKACALHSAHGCVNLGAAYERGNGVHANLEQAGLVYLAACRDGQPVACNNVGYGLWKGLWGLPQNTEKARNLLKLACEANAPKACVNLAWLMRKEDKRARPVDVFGYYERACGLGDRYCDDLADCYHDGFGVPKNRVRAIEVATRLCRAGLDEWCKRIGDWAKEPK